MVVPPVFLISILNMKRSVILLAALLLGMQAVSAASEGRQTENFDAGWKFHLGDVRGGQRPGLSDKSWRTLDLPHDWSIEGENLEDAPGGGRVGYFPSGIGWYRKTFDVPEYAADRLYSIEFDGVYMNSEVWINGNYLGKWPYGYSSFSYDLTPYLKARGNVIAVRVDNSMQPNSRWYTGSGIYRHVRLVSTERLRFEKWGIFVYTGSLGETSATLHIESAILDDSGVYGIDGSGGPVTVKHTLIDAGGEEVAQVSALLTAADKDGGRMVCKDVLEVPSPMLWDTDTPYLYTLRSSLSADGRECDVVETRVGIRTIAYEPDRGFLLNGRQLKMKGVNLHHDGGAVGAAVPERVWARRLEILRSGGCNAIRTAHNIPSPEFLDLCDEYGMLVMDEVFDQWKAGKNAYDYHVDFDEWYEKDLACMILRDRNHPSVVMWSIGNEVPDQSTPEGPVLARSMIDICRSLDPTRPVTSGNDRIAADNEPATEEFLAEFGDEIVGYNYPDRWRTRRETYYTTDKLLHPDRMVVATESGGMGGPRVAREGRSRYATPAAAYIDTEQRWKYTIINDFVIGDFMWTGIDYYGESRWPSRGAVSGYLDNCGFRKDGYYFFKSIWSEDPVLHLAGGWNYDESKRGQIVQVVVFTNCTEVELFVNGRSYGVKTKEFPRKGNVNAWNQSPEGKVHSSTADLHLAWDVEYQPGEVKLVGRKDGGEYTEIFRTAGQAADFRVELDREVIFADPSDVVHVVVEITDAAGTVVPSAENLVRWTVPGARVIGVESGNMSDLSSPKASERKAYGGMCMAIVQADSEGRYSVTVEVEGLGSKTVEFTAQNPQK